MKERLIAFIKHERLTANAFEANCGLGQGFVSKINTGCSSVSLAKIVKTYPYLDMNWLLTGEGEMLRKEEKLPDANALDTPITAYKLDSDVMEFFRDEIKFLRERIINLEKNNN